jgi:predicted nucleic acid-binding protein
MSAQGLWCKAYGIPAKVCCTQVLFELCINLRRKAKPPLDIDETRRLLQDYLTWEIVVSTPESVIQALDIEARYKLSFWDALILHAAERSGAEILYSEDLSDGQVYGAIRVVNPLKDPATLGSHTP